MKRSKLILAVDDDEELLNILGRILDMEGYDIVTATDGISAMTLLEERKPDLVILDVIMPGYDGFKVLPLIRQRSDVPIIMLTALGEVATLRDAVSLGADDYVRKPFRTRELLARIRARLRSAEPRTVLPA